MRFRPLALRLPTATAALVVVALVSPAAGAAPLRATDAAANPPPAAVVRLDNNGKVGRFDVALIAGSARCRAGAIVQELVVSVMEGARSGSTSAIPAGLVCDGAFHRFEVSVGASDFGPFTPGFVDADARLTVLDPDSMDPLPQGHASKQVWLRPAVKLAVLSSGRLLRDGTVRLTVVARCETPWFAAGISLSISQSPPGLIGGETFLPDVPACDGVDHTFRVRVAASVDPFRPGKSQVLGFLTVLDPDSGDPVDQAQVNKVVRLNGPQ
jgi:Family of unknown function (DUF6299)